jgi:glycerol-3-phosphate dehydrogenase (NAD(P)+)
MGLRSISGATIQRSVLERCVPYVTPHHTWVIASKGIERDTLLFPSQIIDAVFKASQQTMVLAGPSFAKDLAAKVITGLSIAAATCQEGIVLQSMLANAYCRPFVHTDLIGAQVGGAIKNVIALGLGMLQGAGYSDNTRALLLTYGLHESVELAIVLGGRAETMYGFSGVGDIVLTSMCSQSRNHQVGYALGKGKKLEDILRETGYTPEGVNSAKSIYQLMHKVNLALPICRGVYEVVYENRSIADMLAVIMDAPLECE